MNVCEHTIISNNFHRKIHLVESEMYMCILEMRRSIYHLYINYSCLYGLEVIMVAYVWMCISEKDDQLITLHTLSFSLQLSSGTGGNWDDIMINEHSRYY